MAVFSADGPVGRATRKVATSGGFRKVAPRIVPVMDRTLHRLSGGRILLSQMMVPTMVLTTTGRKSGLSRDSPLACVPDDQGGWFVVGSNFGREHHPAWTGNLLSDPNASVSFGHADTNVVAEHLSDDGKAEVWPRLIAVWPAYDDYVAGTDRNIRVFHLTPA